MKKIDKKALLEALKEAIRVGLIAIVSYLSSEVVIDGIVVALVGDSLSLNVRLMGIGLIMSGLRALDKFLHVKKVETPLDMKFIK
jgi:hypothetical protein